MQGHLGTHCNIKNFGNTHIDIVERILNRALHNLLFHLLTFVFFQVKLRTASSVKEEEEEEADQHPQEVPRETDDNVFFVNDKWENGERDIRTGGSAEEGQKWNYPGIQTFPPIVIWKEKLF